MTADPTCHDAARHLPHLAPSVQQVFCALYGKPPQTSHDLRQATGLPRRTVYAALQRLKELDVLDERPSLRDTRQTFVWLSRLDKYGVALPAPAVADAAAAA